LPQQGGIVPLSLQSRRVGDITVVKCDGRIVDGPESAALQKHLEALLPHEAHVLLDLADVQFVDSSGLGLLVRFHTRIRNLNGQLKLCGISANVAEVLRVTKLGPVFDSYRSEAEAIAAFYQRQEPGRVVGRFSPTDVLCVENSADVLAFVGELLRQAGYGVVTTDNLPDALTLLQAARPGVIVIGADLRSTKTTDTAMRFNRLADSLRVVELPAGFSRHDAGKAGDDLLVQVRAILGARGSGAATGS
jgi:anti-sigma B factor antagonist